MFKIKSIRFNTEEVKAIINNRKTQTRIVIKHYNKTPTHYKRDKHYKLVDELNNKKGLFAGFYNYNDVFIYEGKQRIDAIYFKSPYKIGDSLYVKETWTVEGVEFENNKWIAYIGYKSADDTQKGYQSKIEIRENEVEKYEGYLYGNSEYRPSIHMPKEAARIFLKVTNVRVERLQDITEENSKKEGAETEEYLEYLDWACSVAPKDIPCKIETVKDNYAKIWNSRIKKKDINIYGWEANPWVWVITFKKCEK